MNSAKIMIVEDNTTVAEDCCDSLEELGYNVTSILASGEECVERAKTEKPDAVLMDIHLRDKMDGIEAAEKIHSSCGIPVVFLSAYSDDELLKRARQVGSFGYLVKPFDERELHATVEMAIYKAKLDAERNDLQEHMQQLQKLESLSVMAGGIAHDFNNMLVGILGNTELAMGELPEDSPAHEFLIQVEMAGKRAAELSQKMLAYSDKGCCIVEPINLNDVVREMSHMLERLVSRKTSLRFDLTEKLPANKADITRIRQIVTSLVVNASEAIGDDAGIITVSTYTAECGRDYFKETYLDENQAAGTYVCLEVADTGCGMEDKIKARLFDPFFTTKFPGRGLGLSAVLGIVRGHKGAIKVDSAPEKGTTVSILLPTCESLETNILEMTTEQLIDWQGTGTILVVDEEEMVRNVILSELEMVGFTVLTASNGQEALDVYREHLDDIVCIVLDFTMAEMDGKETFRQLCKLNEDVCVIFSSGYDAIEVAERSAGEKQPAGFLQKPFSFIELRDKICSVLG